MNTEDMLTKIIDTKGQKLSGLTWEVPRMIMSRKTKSGTVVVRSWVGGMETYALGMEFDFTI